jgi:hypothetical protein
MGFHLCSATLPSGFLLTRGPALLKSTPSLHCNQEHAGAFIGTIATRSTLL